MLICELFDKNPPSNVSWNREPSNNSNIIYSFTIQSKSGPLHFGLNMFPIPDSLDNFYEVSFVKFDNDSSITYDITSTGNEIAVFSAVANILRDVIFNQNIECWALSFNAKEPSRVKLYDALSKRLAKELKWVDLTHYSHVILPWANEGKDYIIANPVKFKDEISQITQQQSPH